MPRVDDGNSLHRIFVERAAIRGNKSTLTYGQSGGGGDDCISDEEPDIRTRPPADVVDGEAAIRISFRRPGEWSDHWAFISVELQLSHPWSTVGCRRQLVWPYDFFLFDPVNNRPRIIVNKRDSYGHHTKTFEIIYSVHRWEGGSCRVTPCWRNTRMY